MRGISRPGVVTTTTAVRGTLADERLQRQFFARLPDDGAASRMET
jgi:GTP cyclohydrolase I